MICLTYDWDLKPLILIAAAYIILMTMVIIYFRNIQRGTENSYYMDGFLS